ncbi:MAG: flagellar motor protein MotB [bacterium]
MEDESLNQESGESRGHGTPKWMVTFADLNCLLLCFFVLLFSFSNTDMMKYRAMVLSMQNAFGVKRKKETVLDKTGTSILRLNPASQMTSDDTEKGKNKDKDKDEKADNPPSEKTPALKDLIEEEKKEIMSELDESVRHLELGEDIEISPVDRGVLLKIKGELLFPLGKAEIIKGGIDVLDKIALVIKRHPSYEIMIEGHTDNLPIHTDIFPSNWELSAARASSVVRLLIEKYHLPPEFFTAVGYADTRPLLPNTTSENRAKNRRVNFLFLIP